MPFNAVVETRYGLAIYNQHDLYVGRSLALYREYSEGEVWLFRQLLKPGMVVVEAGAHVGAHTLFFARAVGSAGDVYAFEPQRLLFQALAGTMALNSIDCVTCLPQCLGDQAGKICVPPLDYGRDNNFGGLELGHWTEGEAVDCVTLDSLALPQLDFIKLDVEGMETAALRGATATLRRCRPVLFVEYDRPEQATALLELLREMGYAAYLHRTPLFNPQNFAGNPENIFPTVYTSNLVCLPAERPQQLSGFEQVLAP